MFILQNYALFVSVFSGYVIFKVVTVFQVFSQWDQEVEMESLYNSAIRTNDMEKVLFALLKTYHNWL